MSTTPRTEVRKLYPSGNSTVVALGDGVLRELGWKPGDTVILKVREDRLEIAWAPIADL